MLENKSGNISETRKDKGKVKACRGYGYPWINPWIYPRIYPCVDMRLRPCCGYIHGYYAGTPAN